MRPGSYGESLWEGGLASMRKSPAARAGDGIRINAKARRRQRNTEFSCRERCLRRGVLEFKL